MDLRVILNSCLNSCLPSYRSFLAHIDFLFSFSFNVSFNLDFYILCTKNCNLRSLLIGTPLYRKFLNLKKIISCKKWIKKYALCKIHQPLTNQPVDTVYFQPLFLALICSYKECDTRPLQLRGQCNTLSNLEWLSSSLWTLQHSIKLFRKGKVIWLSCSNQLFCCKVWFQSYILPTIILLVSQLWSIVSYNDLCAKKLIKANYSWSCQYLQGPAAFDFHILKCTLVANAVVTWIWLNTYFETFDCFFKTKLHIIPGWKAFLKDKSAHLLRWKVSI